MRMQTSLRAYGLTSALVLSASLPAGAEPAFLDNSRPDGKNPVVMAWRDGDIDVRSLPMPFAGPAPAASVKAAAQIGGAPRLVDIVASGPGEGAPVEPDNLSFVTEYEVFYNEVFELPPAAGSSRSLFAEFDTALRIGGRKGFTVETSFEYERLRSDPFPDSNEEHFFRTGTRLIYDNPTRPLRASVGDIVTFGRNFQGISDLAGLSISSAYQTLQPTRDIRTAGEKAVVLRRRSIVRIFRDEVLVEERVVQAGQYSASDFSTGEDVGVLSIQVQDDAGRNETIDLSATGESFLLQRGVVEYDLSIGVEANRFSQGVTYEAGDLVANGYLSRSLTRNVTGSVDFQYTGVAQQVGAEIATLLAGGVFSAGAAGSRISLDTRFGYAVRLRQDWRDMRGGFASIEANYYARNFAIPGFVDVLDFEEEFEPDPDFPEREPPQSAVVTSLPFAYEVNFNAGRTISRNLTLGVTGTFRRVRADPVLEFESDTEWAVSTRASIRLSDSLRFLVTGNAFDRLDRTEFSTFATLQVSFGERSRLTNRFNSRQRSIGSRFERSPGRTVDAIAYEVGSELLYGGQDTLFFRPAVQFLGNRFDGRLDGSIAVAGDPGNRRDEIFGFVEGAIVATPRFVGLAKAGGGENSYVVAMNEVADSKLYLQAYSADGQSVAEYSAREDVTGPPIISDLLSYQETSVDYIRADNKAACVVDQGSAAVFTAYRSVTLVRVQGDGGTCPAAASTATEEPVVLGPQSATSSSH